MQLERSQTPQWCLSAITPHGTKRSSVTLPLPKLSNFKFRSPTSQQSFLSTNPLTGEKAMSTSHWRTVTHRLRKSNIHTLSWIAGLPLLTEALKKLPEESHSSCLQWNWTFLSTQSSRSQGWRGPPSTGQPRGGYLRAAHLFYLQLPWSPSKSQSLMTSRWVLCNLATWYWL